MSRAASLGGGQEELEVVDSELDSRGNIGAKQGVQELCKLCRVGREEQRVFLRSGARPSSV